MSELDGVLTFFSSHHAMRAERILLARSIPVRVVPCPRELSSSCGVALRFPFACAERVKEWLHGTGVQVESQVHYPEERAAPVGWSSLLERLKRRPGTAEQTGGVGS